MIILTVERKGQSVVLGKFANRSQLEAGLRAFTLDKYIQYKGEKVKEVRLPYGLYKVEMEEEQPFLDLTLLEWIMSDVIEQGIEDQVFIEEVEEQLEREEKEFDEEEYYLAHLKEHELYHLIK